MTDLFGNIVWIVGAAAILALIGVSYYSVQKIGALIAGPDIEVDSIFFFGGAFVGMLFLPSSDHATTESRLMLGASIIIGSFFGGLIGLYVHQYLLREPTSRSVNSQAEDSAALKHWSVRAFSIVTKIVLAILFIIGVVTTGAPSNRTKGIPGEDRRENQRSVEEGYRVMSSYEMNERGDKVWVITEADRSSTCLLLPEEY